MLDYRRAIRLSVERAGCQSELLTGVAGQIAIQEARRASASFRPLILLGSVALALSAGAPAYAGLMITPIYGSSITSDPNAAFIVGTIQSAINIYQADFTDPINIAITFQEGGGLGGSSTAFFTLPYTTYYGALKAEIPQTSNDITALASLLPAGANNPVNGSSNINVKSANLRAVSIPTPGVGPGTGTPDGTITLNTSLTSPGSPGSTINTLSKL
jgi:hypothetical protein